MIVITLVLVGLVLLACYGPSLAIRGQMKRGADESLRRLGAAIVPEIKAGRPIPDDAAEEYATLVRLLGGLKRDAVWAFDYCQNMSGIKWVDAFTVLKRGESLLEAAGRLEGPPIADVVFAQVKAREMRRLEHAVVQERWSAH